MFRFFDRLPVGCEDPEAGLETCRDPLSFLQKKPVELGLHVLDRVSGDEAVLDHRVLVEGRYGERTRETVQCDGFFVTELDVESFHVGGEETEVELSSTRFAPDHFVHASFLKIDSNWLKEKKQNSEIIAVDYNQKNKQTFWGQTRIASHSSTVNAVFEKKVRKKSKFPHAAVHTKISAYSQKDTATCNFGKK